MANLIDEELKLVCKITRFMNENDFSLLFDIVDVENSIKEVRQLLESYEGVHISLKRELGKEYAETYQDYSTNVASMSEWIITAKLEIKQRKEEKFSLENKKSLREKEEKINLCRNIYDNICDRFSNVESKCSVNLCDLSDAQILEKKKELKSIDSEFNNILDNILKLSEANPSGFSETNELWDTICERKDELKNAIDLLKNDLKTAIADRDLSDEKVKNASLLGIHLPKFKGYNSNMDFYTFKSEFEKLVSPRVKASLLPDYLKNNYLEGPALQLVKEIEKLEDIWERLNMSFGSVPILLSKKMEEIEKAVPLWKLKGEERIIQSIISVKNSMMELSSLAKKHNIEHNLFHTSNLAKIYNLLGRKRQVEITRKLVDLNKNDEETWEEIINFLDKELKVKEQVLLFEKSNPKNEDLKSKSRNNETSRGYSVQSGQKKCLICGKTDHVPTITKHGNLIINYFSCEKFCKMNIKARLAELKRLRFCLQCLTPGLKMGHEGRCFDKYKCPDESHNHYRSGLHILICDRHKNNPENLQLLEQYKEKYILNGSHKEFSENINIALHVSDQESYGAQRKVAEGEDYSDMAIYMLQTIKVGSDKLNVFFDSGCGDMVCSKHAIDVLSKQNRAKNICKDHVILSGVGNQKSVCEYGRFQIRIPLYNNKDVNFSGICLDTITSTFPTYPLREVAKDITKDYVAAGGNPRNLPKLPNSVGGNTDLMLGIQYLKYFPKEIHKMKNGLSIFESQFISEDGSRGVVGGPHKSFTEVHKRLSNNHANMSAYVTKYFTKITQEYRKNYWLGVDVNMLGIKGCEVTFDNVENSSTKTVSNDQIGRLSGSCGFNDENKFPPKGSNPDESKSSAKPLIIGSYAGKNTLKNMKCFEKVEKAGTEASYRCIRCRGCSDCKKSAEIETVSLQEEVQQGLIDKSVKVNPEKCYTEAYLPFLCDPTKRLTTNLHRTEKIYYKQVKSINSKSAHEKQELKNAMKKLRDLGFVEKLENLTDEQKSIINSNPVKYYIPWLVVNNTNSISTPCRPVFNASCPTDSGYSLNDLLPKGRNNLNKLVQIFIRWSFYRCAFHTDVQKMYNTIRLVEDHWCYQLFLWEDELNVNVKPLVWVIKTLIYGVRPSGNQAERALRETTNIFKEQYPRQNEIIQKDTYVDDCFSGENSFDEAREVTDDLQIVLNKGGFRLKGITFSGLDPPDHLCNDDKSVTVAGMKWIPKSDLLGLNIGELNFGKKVRGKKSEKSKGLLPEKFTRRDCASRIGEIFDLLGKFAPLIAEFKLDLHELSFRKLEWDDFVPDDLVLKWRENFEKIDKMGEIQYKRCLVPEDAINLDIETIEMADASLNMACSAIYARFQRKNGLYSCQLIFARTKIIPTNMTIPRGEMFAAALNAATGHIVFTSLQRYIKNRISLTDSQIALFWINNTQGQLKQWVRGRVIEINRLTNKENWYYIQSSNMTADIGTRPGAKISDVLEGSTWINGQDWAKYGRDTFPIKSVKDIKLSKEDMKNHNDEILNLDVSDTDWINRQLSNSYCKSFVAMNEGVLDNVGQRYQFSNYIIDPNKFRLRKVVRIVSLLFLFVKKMKQKIGKFNSVVSENKLPDNFNFNNDRFLVTQAQSNFPFICSGGLVVELSEEQILESLNYFYKKASMEIKHFNSKSSYDKISVEKSQILYYTGRILPSQIFDKKVNLSDACIDLTMASFCVPLVDKYSPVAYALINEVHWYDDDAKHSGNETVMRYVQKVAHIIEGKPLIKLFRNECPRCRYLRKKAIDVAMGPKSSENFSIAPAFYISQVDLFGPYNSYSNVNKRAMTKVWFVIFCCCATGAVDIKVTEDYSTSSFILAFIRFSCKVGYPKKLLPDAGSQLVKGCKSMKLTFTDVRSRLNEFGVEVGICPVGAHYMHGKVERKIKHVKESFEKNLQNHRLSIIQWETLGNQVANSINNLPIAIGNVTKDLENLDLLTPNRLLLARNNSRCPVGSVTVTEEVDKIIRQNNNVFEAWFRAWLTSYVPTLMVQPKWFKSDRDPKVGDIVLFLKSDKNFEKLYQYGIICDLKKSRDGKIRQLEVEYQNHTEKVKRKTNRGTREVVVIHPCDELGLIRELNILSAKFT